MNFELLQKVAIIGPALLFSVIAHEIAHGWAALRQGDDTAQKLGRLTWNPIPHIDPFFTILLPAIMMLSPGGGILGGAKPVPVNPANYRNLRRGDIIVSLAGVATNLLIVVACALLIVAFGLLARVIPAAVPVLGYLQALVIFAILLNWILIIFNLLPIPPLDGSHVVKYLLPRQLAVPYVVYGSRFGFLILIGLVLFWQEGLGTLLDPAFRATRAIYEPTFGFWIPENRPWLSWMLP